MCSPPFCCLLTSSGICCRRVATHFSLFPPSFIVSCVNRLRFVLLSSRIIDRWRFQLPCLRRRFSTDCRRPSLTVCACPGANVIAHCAIASTSIARNGRMGRHFEMDTVLSKNWHVDRDVVVPLVRRSQFDVVSQDEQPPSWNSSFRIG